MTFKNRVRCLQNSKLVSRESEKGAKRTYTKIIEGHFNSYSNPSHINRVGLEIGLRNLSERPALIVETGSSAWGVDSSRLFASYVNTFGGKFISIDIRDEPSQKLGNLGPNVTFIVGDSISVLNSLHLPAGFEKIDLLYLDSCDLDTKHPQPPMDHEYQEFTIAQKFLSTGSIVIIDDTPIVSSLLGDDAVKYEQTHGLVMGKGRLILESHASGTDFEVLYHHYNIVLRHN